MSKDWLGTLGMFGFAATAALLGWSLGLFDGEPRPAAYDATQRSTELAYDLRLMQETEPSRASDDTAAAPPRVSTDRAINAASRVFNTVQLVGHSRSEVIELVGEQNAPVHPVNNANLFVDEPPERLLVYRFHSGAYGWEFKILFDADDNVKNVQRTWVQ